MTSRNLVLRTMYIEPEIDDMLRNEAFDSRTSKNDLLRKYLRLGMAAAKNEAAPAAAAEPAVSKRKRTLTAVQKANAEKRSTGTAIARKPAAKPAVKPAAKPAAKSAA